LLQLQFQDLTYGIEKSIDKKTPKRKACGGMEVWHVRIGHGRMAWYTLFTRLLDKHQKMTRVMMGQDLSEDL
jgi:hypothetical protein